MVTGSLAVVRPTELWGYYNDSEVRAAVANELGLDLWRWQAKGNDIAPSTRFTLTVLLSIAKNDGRALPTVALLDAGRIMVEQKIIPSEEALVGIVRAIYNQT